MMDYSWTLEQQVGVIFHCRHHIIFYNPQSWTVHSILPHPPSFPFLFPPFPRHQLSCLLRTANKSVTISGVTAGWVSVPPPWAEGGRRTRGDLLQVWLCWKSNILLRTGADWVRAVGGKDGRKWPPHLRGNLTNGNAFSLRCREVHWAPAEWNSSDVFIARVKRI